MNLEQTIKELMSRHTQEWFGDISDEFKNHSYYVAKSDMLKYDIEYEDQVPVEVDEKNNPISYESQINVRSENKSLPEYCWSTSTTAEFDSSLSDLEGTFEAINEKLESVLAFAGTMYEKKLIILKARDLVTSEIKMLQSKKNFLYNGLLNHFLQRFKWDIIERYNDIRWFINTFPVSATTNIEISETHKHKKKGTSIIQPAEVVRDSVEQKKKLTIKFFRSLFDSYDQSDDPIIKPEQFSQKEDYSKFFYNLYKGQAVGKQLQIDFNWNKHPIYYILTKIINWETKLELKKLEKLNCIKIKGEKFKSRLCSTGASKFKNASSHQLLKEYIDELFTA